jgi:hypothetical protein
MVWGRAFADGRHRYFSPKSIEDDRKVSVGRRQSLLSLVERVTLEIAGAVR